MNIWTMWNLNTMQYLVHQMKTFWKVRSSRKIPALNPAKWYIYATKRKVISENLLQISIMILIDNIKMIFAVNMSL